MEEFYILEVISCDSREKITRIEIGISDFLRICTLLNRTFSDLELLNGVLIRKKEVVSINKIVKIGIIQKNHALIMRKKRKFEYLPYKIHTNRELDLMLKGIKPLAFFSDTYPSADADVIPEKSFDKYVCLNRLKKIEFINLREPEYINGIFVRGNRVVLYALPHEDWRFDAFVLVQNTAQKCGWTESTERMLGYLLGYEEWQNDAYIKLFFR